MKKRWIILMAILVVISVMGLFAPEQPELWTVDSNVNNADVAWMITATIFVLMMTPGLSLFYGGMVRQKNVISTILQSFIAMGVISIIWVVFGFSLAFGDDIGSFVGNPATFFMFDGVGAKTDPLLAPTIPLALFALFQMKFAIITPSLITGSFAERVRFSGYLVFMMLFCIFVYCPLAHWTWHPDGFLRQMGVVDFAGGIVVHASSGVAALAGAIFLGKRTEQNSTHVPANIPFVILGAAMLWLGWFGFNAGSSLAANGVAVKAFLNTNTASATAMMAWVVFDCLRGRKPSAMGAAIGAVVGLVAITPSAGFVTVGESIFIALVTTIVCNVAVYWKNHTSVDDALDVFPTHGVGGILGTVLTGVFVHGLIDGHWDVFFIHILAVIIVCVYTFVVTYALYWLTNKMIPMRVSANSERIGLDISQHDEQYGMLEPERELAEYSEGEVSSK
ncbi:MAG: ammonium transporter [Bacteroides graminisolvens]|jgi:Amt family ammonium transporter|uniref:Ammonium transporter n=1 Tax=Bacteroides graminisolvens DSM 19988 = JCM 15093 TaxID=1121097 RepID=A0A069D1R7_9BACE|nr:ammonium transporter [Bacteroides graminisolvens]MBP6980705.1 ammonium transporter [Bacteroides sp.]MBP9495717.1 ammonium transporter [Bacteroides sp.]MCD8475188.1 ammonium transporter [Bacteroides graminisolvens]MCD8495487.1 ammonium transporter [Bacteroides graminisolvens]GAK36231.1 ammonium transporter [Bacteroides graminisolvens DSM 19988 = JCM 15093]